MRIKISFCAFLIFSFAFFAISAVAQENNKTSESDKNLTLDRLTVGDINKDSRLDISDLPQHSGNLVVAGNIGVGKKTADEKIDVQGRIKSSEGFCIGEDCKNNWPKFKCAEYSGRPKGESGDNYCDSCDKTCIAVFLGSGSTSFNECSAIPTDQHKVRCCWVE